MIAIVKEIKNIRQLLLGARFIGYGTNSVCFLLKNQNVLKVYYNSYSTRELFRLFDMKEHLIEISKIGNKSYTVPRIIYTNNDKVIAYEYDYIKSKTLKKAKKNIFLDELIDSLDLLYEDTKLVSSFGFKNCDVHSENILFKEKYYIIDLDKGSFCDISADFLANVNQRLILNSITEFIFKDDFLFFEDEKLNDLYRAMIYTDCLIYKDFFNYLKEKMNNDNPTINEIRAQKLELLKKYHNDI